MFNSRPKAEAAPAPPPQAFSANSSGYPEQRQSRGALASTASNASSGGGSIKRNSARGVHFGATPDGRAGNAAGDGALATAQPSENLARQMEIISPQLMQADSQRIGEVLAAVRDVCQECVTQSGCAADSSGDPRVGQLLPLGSYYLGVMLPHEEVDVLYVAPGQLQLNQFPTWVSVQLQQTHGQACADMCMAPASGQLSAPGLCFTLQGVRVKLLMTQVILGLPQPSNEIIVPNQAGLIAREVSEKLLSHVPNTENFRFLLRFVRHWSKHRGVRGSYVGYLSGTAWAICCARVCQMYPHMEPPQLVSRFFRTLSRWDWKQPLVLLPPGVTASADAPTATSSLAVGSSDGPASAFVTVMFPIGSNDISATKNVTGTTTKIMAKELRRGYKLVQQAEVARTDWADIYAGARFFQRHRHYLEFDFMASSEAVLAMWLAWGRQQMTELVTLFETLSSTIVTLRPWPEWVIFKDSQWAHARAVFVGLHLERTGEENAEGVRRSFDLREPIVKFLENISAWSEADRYQNQFELLIRHVRSAELETWLENQRRGLVTTDKGTPNALASSAQGALSDMQQCSL